MRTSLYGLITVYAMDAFTTNQKKKAGLKEWQI
jgi:hypothetical protein